MPALSPPPSVRGVCVRRYSGAPGRLPSLRFYTRTTPLRFQFRVTLVPVPSADAAAAFPQRNQVTRSPAIRAVLLAGSDLALSTAVRLSASLPARDAFLTFIERVLNPLLYNAVKMSPLQWDVTEKPVHFPSCFLYGLS